MRAQLIGWLVLSIIAILGFQFYKLGLSEHRGYPGKRESYDCVKIAHEPNYYSPKWAQDMCLEQPYKKTVP